MTLARALAGNPYTAHLLVDNYQYADGQQDNGALLIGRPPLSSTSKDVLLINVRAADGLPSIN